MENYINEFRNTLINEDKSTNTIDAYVSDVLEFINWYQDKNNCGIEKLIALDVREYEKYLRQYKVTGQNRKLCSLRKYINYLYDDGIIKDNIIIKQIKLNEQPKFKGLDDKDLWKLRKEIHRSGNELHICIFELLLNTGVRVSELCSIRLQDINISDRKGSLNVIGKGNKQRTIPLNKDVRDAVQGYLTVRKECNEYLLQGQRGTMTRKGIDAILRQYGNKLNIDISAHKIRHTLAYKLISDKDVSITTVQSLLGHKNINTTMLYTQTKQEDKEKALNNIEW